MSETSLFEMEWENVYKKNNLHIDPLSLFREIEKELGEKLLKGGGHEDSADGPLAFVENLTDNLQVEFDETLGESSGRKLFTRSLTKICTIYF